jgi:integrase
LAGRITPRPRAAITLPYLWLQKVKGRPYAYYRRDGQRIPIKGEPGSAEFLAAYQRVHASFVKPRAEAPQQGSFAALVQHYRTSPDFRQLAPQSQRDYLRILEGLLKRFGPLSVATLPRALIFRLRDELADHPRTANYTIAVLRRVLSFAVDHGYRPDNPALRPRLLQTGQGHRPWTDVEIAAFRAAWPASTVQRVAFELALHTGQRAGDLISLTRHNYRDGWFSLKQRKTGQPVDIPAAPALRTVLDPWLASHDAMLILVAAKGRPFAIHHFIHLMRAAYEGAGLSAECTTHGLRYTCATLLAEQGCDWPTIAAVTGHRTCEMVRKYTSRRRSASTAIERLANRTEKRGDGK